MFVDVAMIILGLFGALTASSSKWGYFAVACFFQLAIVYGLFVPGKRSSSCIAWTYEEHQIGLCNASL